MRRRFRRNLSALHAKRAQPPCGVAPPSPGPEASVLGSGLWQYPARHHPRRNPAASATEMPVPLRVALPAEPRLRVRRLEPPPAARPCKFPHLQTDQSRMGYLSQNGTAWYHRPSHPPKSTTALLPQHASMFSTTMLHMSQTKPCPPSYAASASFYTIALLSRMGFVTTVLSAPR